MTRNTTSDDDAQTVRVYANDLELSLIAAWTESNGTRHGFELDTGLDGDWLSIQAVDSRQAEGFIHVNDVVTPDTRVVDEQTVEDLGVRDTVKIDGEQYHVEVGY